MAGRGCGSRMTYDLQPLHRSFGEAIGLRCVRHHIDIAESIELLRGLHELICEGATIVTDNHQRVAKHGKDMVFSVNSFRRDDY